MARIFIDQLGRIYTNSSPTSVNDSEMLNPSTELQSSASGTPDYEASVKQRASAARRGNNQNKW